MTTRDQIRSLPAPKWTVDEVHHIGSTIDHTGRITVVFKRGSIVQHVKVRADFLAEATDLANAAVKQANGAY